MVKTVSVLGFNIIQEDLSQVVLNEKIVINTISPNSYGLSVKDPAMDRALKNSDYLVLDGVYFGLAALVLKGKRVRRITGWDCFQFFSKKMDAQKGRVFFLGSTENTLLKLKARFQQDFPNAAVGTYSPPLKAEFNEDDNRKMHQMVNDFKPQVLFIAMTAPKQEKWSVQNRDFIDVNIISTIGNVFDWYAGNSTRPNVFWQKIGMEWLVRIFYRPEILKRNLANQMLFFWHLMLYSLKLKNYD